MTVGTALLTSFSAKKINPKTKGNRNNNQCLHTLRNDKSVSKISIYVVAAVLVIIFTMKDKVIIYS